MDDGEVEISDSPTSIDSCVDEFLKNTTCTHTHTCNLPGPDAAAHTHTCHHTHTQVFPSGEDGGAPPRGEEHPAAKPRRPPGNREAVRKYREKKKAHTAYLEEEVKKLRLQNQQMIRKLQGKAILESEILRLKGLFVDLRGKIDSELGGFPFENKCNAAVSFKGGDCGMQSNGSAVGLECENEMPCFHPQVGGLPPAAAAAAGGGTGKTAVSWEESCQPAVVDCRADTNDAARAEGCAIDGVETLVSPTSQAE